ncbi:hypothetical protein NM688_g1509 [Phlebia brevispora]|uniref:Uncharacterized protein n=1 Tax=Phlebia brevispora TaxID=194682 RepID=A0ACC1TBK4_9APHY|nr:hypothetical protein NM688_g1509 [Phlebia brevispora]
MRQKRPRNAVDSQDILLESARRPRKASWKQQELDEEERKKYEKQLLKELKRVRQVPSSKPAQKEKGRYEFDDEDDGHVEVESEEDEEAYTPLFRSLGVVEPQSKGKPSRKRKLAKRPIVQDSDDANLVVIEDEATQSTAPSSSRASSRMSMATSPPLSRSQSPMNMIVDSPADSEQLPRFSSNPKKTTNSGKPTSTPSEQLSSGEAHDNGKAASSEVAQLTRSRSPSTKAVPRDIESKRTRIRSRSPDASALHKSELIAIRYNTKDGKIPTRGKPNESDYPERERLLIRNAIKSFIVKIYTECAFPDDSTGLQWASNTWNEVCKTAGRQYSEVDCDRIIKLIRGRAVTVRGHLRDEYRDLIVPFFKINEDTTKKTNREENAVRIKQLKEGKPAKFTYRNYDIDPPTYYAEAHFLLLGLQKRIFRDSNSAGATAPRSFSPMPLPTLAFALTTVEFCLDAWASGELNSKLRYEEKIYGERYKTHLIQLKEWEALNTVVVTKIRAKMFRTILKLGKIPELEPKKQEPLGLSKEAAEHARLDLAGRKVDTESEGEDK